jgi:carotenoid cleavage dioxygenase
MQEGKECKMNTLKPASKPDNSLKQPNTERRSFIWKIGAGMTAVLATAVPGIARTRINQDTGLKDQVHQLSNQLRIIEDENAIRNLHQAYEDYLNKGMYEDVVNLFTNDGEVVLNGGVFEGRKRGIRRLYSEQFRSGLTGRKIDPAPGFQPNIEQQQDKIEVATDRKSAKAQFTYSIQVGVPIVSDSQLVKMARLQGQGIMKWWEGGVYEVSYVKDTKDGSWKIKKLEHRVLSKADYRPGKSCARPIFTPPLSKRYPEDPTGPDRLIAATQRLRKV